MEDQEKTEKASVKSSQLDTLVMQREIRFRGISKERVNGLGIEIGSSVYGYLFKEGDEMLIMTNIGHNYDIKVYAKSVGQFTGLKDKNGKEIYEGDILRDERGYIGEVIYLKVGFRLFHKPTKCAGFNTPQRFTYVFRENGVYTIVGNINENPELLKVA